MSAPTDLKAWREARGLSLDAAGKLVEVTAVGWRTWEQGDNPPRPAHREALEVLTGIPASEWRTDDELQLVERVRARAAQQAAEVASTGTEG